mmetsp:Transcript_4308/g.3772  ORF Transcript_4308/g.3772 Transcript_4308/m.3772 type:complete len:191 (-) Transcript_4308:575-1147(-)
MFRLTRPISILFRSTQRSLIKKSTPSLISIHKYNFAGGAAKDRNNVSGLGGLSPGEDPNANDINNPYLWDPHYMPAEESDFERHHYHLEDHEKGRYAIPLNEQVRNMEATEVLKRVSRVLNKMDRAQTDNKTIAHQTHLYNDLGLDSLDQVEFGLGLEEEFDIEIPDEEAEQIVTIGDAVELICDHPGAC